jgi:hypothetical protein
LEQEHTDENNTGLMFHPKVGLGQGIFHFAFGGLANTTNGTLELSGNVFIVNDKFMGGVGFTKNRVFFSVGVNPDFIN